MDKFFKYFVVGAIAIVSIFFIYYCGKPTAEAGAKVVESGARLIDVGGKIVDKTAAVVASLSQSKESFGAILGPIVSQERVQQLQFCKRSQVAFFRILRYRNSKDKTKNIDKIEFYCLEKNKTKLAELPIFMNQYCEWEAKGTFEFTFYVDMTDLDKWNIEWDAPNKVLTIYPSAIKANIPAELEPIRYTCIADSVSVDETYTKKALEDNILRLKTELAEDQCKYVNGDAEVAIRNQFQKFLKLIAKSKNIQLEWMPEIKVIFAEQNKGNELKKLSSDFARR